MHPDYCVKIGACRSQVNVIFFALERVSYKEVSKKKEREIRDLAGRRRIGRWGVRERSQWEDFERSENISDFKRSFYFG